VEAASPARIPERPHAGREEVEEHAEREKIAPRVVADPEDLLGRHVRSGAVRNPELLFHQVRKLVVVRQAEVHERGLPRSFPDDDVRRLDVQMDHVLPVNRVQGFCHPRADRRHLRVGQGQLFQERQERRPGNPLHHE
jgi:hypothetical protein